LRWQEKHRGLETLGTENIRGRNLRRFASENLKNRKEGERKKKGRQTVIKK